MIEFTFCTADGPIVIQLSTPVATPEANRPWAIEVRLNGRPSTIVGEDPLEALALAARFAASYLSGREGLDPPVNELPLTQAPDLLAQGFREGLLTLLDVRGIPCPDASRARIAACADPATLQIFLARARTAVSVDEVFAAVPRARDRRSPMPGALKLAREASFKGEPRNTARRSARTHGASRSAGVRVTHPPHAMTHDISPTLLHVDRGFSVSTWKNVFIIAWGRRATVELVNTAWGLADRFSRAHEEGISCVHITFDDVPLADAAVLDRFQQFSEEFADKVAAVVCIIPGAGSRANALRTLIAGVLWFERRRLKVLTCGSIDEAAGWLPAPHVERTGEAIEAVDLASVLRRASAAERLSSRTAKVRRPAAP